MKGANYKETFKNNSVCEFEVPAADISPEMRDLIVQSTARDPEKRLSISEFLNHDIFHCNISDSEDFEISYKPQKAM